MGCFIAPYELGLSVCSYGLIMILVTILPTTESYQWTMQFASEGLKAQNSILYSGNLSQEKIFINQAILLSEEIFVIFVLKNLPGDFCDF